MDIYICTRRWNLELWKVNKSGNQDDINTFFSYLSYFNFWQFSICDLVFLFLLWRSLLFSLMLVIHFKYLQAIHIYKCHQRNYPAGIQLLKVNNKNTRTKVWNMFKVNNKDTKMTPMVSFCVFIVKFEHIWHLCSSVFIVNFKYVIGRWDIISVLILTVPIRSKKIVRIKINLNFYCTIFFVT